MNFITIKKPMRVLNVAFDVAVDVAFDVGSQNLNWASKPNDQLFDGQSENNSQAIVETLGS